MRYRPFGRSGLALSTVGLRLKSETFGRNHALMQKLIVSALENGINTYQFDSLDVPFLRAAAEAFAVVDRKLLFISATAHEPFQTNDPDAYALTPLKERLRGAIKFRPAMAGPALLRPAGRRGPATGQPGFSSQSAKVEDAALSRRYGRDG